MELRVQGDLLWVESPDAWGSVFFPGGLREETVREEEQDKPPAFPGLPGHQMEGAGWAEARRMSLAFVRC